VPYGLGSTEEALTFVHLALPSWKAIPGLLSWLTKQGQTSTAVSHAATTLRLKPTRSQEK